MRKLLPDPDVSDLVAPVADLLARGLRLLPGGPAVAVRLGPTDGFYALQGQTVILSEALAGEAVYHPAERDDEPRLDRWRRALSSILEGVSLLELSRRVGRPADLSDWRWVGAGVYAADAVTPDAGLALPDIAAGLAAGDLVACPRAGVLPYLGWRQQGSDPVQQAQYLLDGGIVSPPEWVRLAAWFVDPRGPVQRLPVPVPRPSPVDIPTDLSPWSWRHLSVPPHGRGGKVEVQGDGAVVQPWAVADEPLHTLAGATERGCSLLPGPGGPTGRWEVASAEGFGQIMGARGIEFDLRPSGELQLVLADAFVGPLAAVAMAEEVGTSGVSSGRWAVAGPQRLAFQGLRTASMTMHGRRQGGFAVPAGSFGIGAWLHALEEAPWAWKQTPDRLVLRGHMQGVMVEVRLRPVGG
jgi:hypothetical protein